MKYLFLLWGNLKRKKIRTLFTLLSIVIAFLLFGLLAAIKQATTAGIDMAGVDRLVTTHKVSLIQFLPVYYQERIRQLDGVEEVSSATWFGATYQNSRNVIGAFPVNPQNYLQMYPEYLLPNEQKQAWFSDRTGMLVGKTLAEQHGWQVGDRVPITSSIWSRKDGSFTWEMTISGIYSTQNDRGEQSSILMHYDYFNEARSFAQDMVGWFVVSIKDPQTAPAIAAQIDTLFTNSPAETKTSTEKAFAQGFANQIGDISTIVTVVAGAVFFTMLLVTANTMMQSVHERTRELGILKTLGFSSTVVTSLVLLEAILITAIGGIAGLLLAQMVIGAMSSTVQNFFPVFYLPLRDIIIGLLFMLLFGLIAGALPAAYTMRLRVVDALRRA